MKDPHYSTDPKREEWRYPYECSLLPNTFDELLLSSDEKLFLYLYEYDRVLDGGCDRKHRFPDIYRTSADEKLELKLFYLKVTGIVQGYPNLSFTWTLPS